MFVLSIVDKRTVPRQFRLPRRLDFGIDQSSMSCASSVTADTRGRSRQLGYID